MPVHQSRMSKTHALQFACLALRVRCLGGVAVLAIAAAVTSGAATAQQAGYVHTAPTARAPKGFTVDQGAGVPGLAAFPSAPHPAEPHPHGPENPQAGVPGTHDPSGLGD